MRGSLNQAITTASKTSATAIMMYGSFTEDACSMRYAWSTSGVMARICSIVLGALARINIPPK